MKIIVVGAGKLGYDISRILSEERHDVIVVDKDPEHLKAIASNLDVMTVVGNGASPTTLREINVAETDIMLAVTENDELNMIACMTAKQSGVGMTVARVRNPDYTSDHPLVLSYAHYGIDLIINPEYLAAQEIFRLVHVPMASDIEYFFDGRLSMIGLKIGDEMAISGKHIADIGLNRFTVIAVVRKDQVFIPNGGTQLLSGDTIYVLGRANGFHGLNGLLKLNKDKFRRVVIAGGGIITEYLVRMLQDKKSYTEIRIIEPNLDKCRSITARFQKPSLVCGDPTKMEILAEENLDAKDIFISLTGSDNSNIIACMQAKRLGVKEIICETSREDYIQLAEGVGATATITPRLLTVGTLLKIVRKSNALSINLLHWGDAEIMELVAEPESPVTKKPLRNLDLPAGVIIGAVVHEDGIIVPRGDTCISARDHVIVSGLKSRVTQVERFFRAPASDDKG